MAKKKAEPGYEYVRATVKTTDDGDVLCWDYKLPGRPAGSMRHDEDVAGWSDADVESLTRSMLDMGPGEEVSIVRE